MVKLDRQSTLDQAAWFCLSTNISATKLLFSKKIEMILFELPYSQILKESIREYNQKETFKKILSPRKPLLNFEFKVLPDVHIGFFNPFTKLTQ